MSWVAVYASDGGFRWSCNGGRSCIGWDPYFESKSGWSRDERAARDAGLAHQLACNRRE